MRLPIPAEVKRNAAALRARGQTEAPHRAAGDALALIQRATDDVEKRIPLVFLRTEAGAEPVRDWLRTLPKPDRRIVGEGLKQLEYGWPIGMPLCRALGGGLRESTMKKRANRYRGSSLDEFLEEEVLLEEATAKAVKKALAWQLTRAMEEQRMTKATLARRMNTSRAQLDRLLDPENQSVTLKTLARAAEILGLRVQIELVAA